jgi:hypothetical protein
VANVCAHLSTHKGTNNRDRQHYLPDERTDDGVDRWLMMFLNMLPSLVRE